MTDTGRTYRAGHSVDDLCRACKTLRDHTVMAVSSDGASHAFPQYALVGASKGALESLCRHLAIELAAQGVRVNVLSPGTVMTSALDAFPDKDARVQEALQRSPRGRLTTLEEQSRGRSGPLGGAAVRDVLARE